MKKLTQALVSTTCDYLIKVAGLPITSLELKTHLRSLDYEAGQQEVSAMLKEWSRNSVDVVSYVTYKQIDKVGSTDEPVLAEPGQLVKRVAGGKVAHPHPVGTVAEVVRITGSHHDTAMYEFGNYEGSGYARFYELVVDYGFNGDCESCDVEE